MKAALLESDNRRLNPMRRRGCVRGGFLRGSREDETVCLQVSGTFSTTPLPSLPLNTRNKVALNQRVRQTRL